MRRPHATTRSVDAHSASIAQPRAEWPLRWPFALVRSGGIRDRPPHSLSRWDPSALRRPSGVELLRQDLPRQDLLRQPRLELQARRGIPLEASPLSGAVA